MPDQVRHDENPWTLKLSKDACLLLQLTGVFRLEQIYREMNTTSERVVFIGGIYHDIFPSLLKNPASRRNIVFPELTGTYPIILPIVYRVPFPCPCLARYPPLTSSRSFTFMVFLFAFVIDSISEMDN